MILPRSWSLTSARDATRRHATHSGFSRSLMQELILTGGLAPGSRLLIAGCGDGELAERLIPFGIQVTGIDSAEDSIERATWLVPEAEFQTGLAPRSQFDPVATPFDSMVVLASPAYRAGLRQVPAKLITASLLNCLRPDGTFHFVATGPGGLLPHEPSCLADHLHSFPGKVHVTGLAGQRTESESFRPHLVTLKLDGRRRTVLEWDRFAQVSSASSEPCCRFCPISSPAVDDARVNPQAV